MWSHSIDNGSWDSGSYLIGEGIGASRDRGSSNFDVRHPFSAGLNYDLPGGRLPSLLRNWSLHGIARLRSGFPIDILARENAFGLGFDNLRPDLLGATVWIRDPRAPGGQRLNAGAFAVPAGGRQGTLGRNALRGRGMGQVDLAVERRFGAWRDSALLLRAQVHNVANTPAFADPVRALANSLFGESTSMLSVMMGTGRPSSGLAPAFQAGTPRTIQLSLHWIF